MTKDVILDTAVDNRVWARHLIQRLVEFGVTTFCIAPGSRSTPLTLEAAIHAQTHVHTHFDERGLAFFALGLAKASKIPVAVIVTSGTAVANLLPAIVEANLTGEPLVVLTADRPPELVGCGANQAIMQQDIFSHHVTAQVALPLVDLQQIESTLLQPVTCALLKQQQLGATVHINVPFQEPLYVSDEQQIDISYQPITSKDQHSLPVTCSCAPLTWHQFGLIIVGSVEYQQALQAEQLAKALGWPIVFDAQCGTNNELAGFDVWMQAYNESFQRVTQVVQIGARIVSKRLNQWLVKQSRQVDLDYHIVQHDWRDTNQHRLAVTHHQHNISLWLDFQIANLSTVQTCHDWYLPERQWAKRQQDITQAFLEDRRHVSEVGFASGFAPYLAGADLFIGNSLVVRLVDMFSVLNQTPVYTNRGASGIDGLLATAKGVQTARQRPMLTLIGDTSLLYDLNSLALFTGLELPHVIVVTNNDGGAIFDLLPVAKTHHRALYQMPHGYDFKHAAEQFHLQYQAPYSLQETFLTIEKHLTQGKGCLLIELKVAQGEAVEHLQQIIQQLKSV